MPANPPYDNPDSRLRESQWTRRPNGMEDREAEQIARAFHEEYEHIAPRYGYETRPASAVPWPEVPESNRLLMIATVRGLILRGQINVGPAVQR